MKVVGSELTLKRHCLFMARVFSVHTEEWEHSADWKKRENNYPNLVPVSFVFLTEGVNEQWTCRLANLVWPTGEKWECNVATRGNNEISRQWQRKHEWILS